MAAPTLPPALHARLDALALRVRRLRVARGACWLAVAVLLSAAGIVLLDAAVKLSVAARCLLEAAWLASASGLAWWLVARPWRADVPLDEIARRIESQFPGLGERLLTVVSLRDDADPANGSPRLIAGLARDTELRTRELDFTRAAPTRPVAWLAAAAGVVFVAALVSAAVMPGSGEQLRRVGLPWHRPAAVAPFRIHVSSGDPVVRRGDPVTLSAYAERAEPGAILPVSAVLVFREPGGEERRLPMAGDESAAFHLTRPHVAADFEYRIESGPVASEWHSVLVADPVEVTEQTAIEIAAPAYAAAAFPLRTLTGPTDLDGLQHSTATLRLRFNRPAASAALDWRAEGRLTESPELIPVDLAADGTGGTATFRMRGNGTLRVVLVNENGPRKLRTEMLLVVRVTPDAPPRFEQVAGIASQPRDVRPGERVPVWVVAADDIAIAAAELEYSVGPDATKTSRVPIPLSGANTPRAEGKLTFDLTGKGTEGETIRVRVRVTDGRRVDDLRLGPQEAVYPPNGWAEFRLSASAPPLDRQEVFGQRDGVKEALLAALEEVRQARADVESLRPETLGKRPDIRETVRRAVGLLHDAARDAALTPELRPLAAAIRDIADRPLRDADDSLRKGTTDAALKQLAEAGDRIEELLKRNDRLAQDRLDRRRLDDLAGDQGTLADKAKPGTTTPPNDLLAAQKDLLDRLRRLVAESDPLKRGTEAAAGREARRLADDARALSGMLRELDAAARQLNADFRRTLLDGIAGAQTCAADQAAALLARIETAARLAGVAPPRADAFRKVAHLLRQDKPVEALVELEKLAAALDHAAEAFEKWELDRKDAKAAARQLAQWQDDLRSRVLAATKATPLEQLPDPVKAALRAEQRAILEAAEALRLPHAQEIADARGVAMTALQHAVRVIDGDGTAADGVLKAAADALNRLADRIPTLAVRLAAARGLLDPLRVEQDQILIAAEPLLRAADPKLPQPLAERLSSLRDRQEKLARQLAAVDHPGFEPRKARTIAAINLAAADMRAGLPYDSTASLHRAKRDLDRLRQALDTPPADDRAADLARRQAALADGIDAKPTPKRVEALAAEQREIAKHLLALLAPEAPAMLNDAQRAAQFAESGFRESAKPDELLRRTRAAAEAVARLSDRLNNLETDLERVRRLADYRRAAARLFDDAKKGPPKPYNPDVSNEAARQLVREAEELTHTRVGATVQPLKRIVVELYARYRNHTEPDRQGLLHKELTDALDRLSATMAEVQELAAVPDRPNPAVPAEADAYLPSKLLADALRELARQQRAVRDRANGVNADVARQTRPAETNPLAALEQRQRALAALVAEFARRLIIEKEPTAADDATKVAEAARLAADRLTIGQVRPAREAAELVAQRLRQLMATAGNKPWGNVAADLAVKQEDILKALTGLLDKPDVAAARQQAREAELSKKAFELAHMLELAAKNAPPGDPGGAALMDAAGLAHKAEAMLAEAANKTKNGLSADAEKLRIDADKLLAQAGERAAMAGGSPGTKPEADPSAVAAGDAVRDADAAMKRAADALGPNGDPAGAERAMRQASDALNRAAKSAGNNPGQPPPNGPGGGPQSNGNTGTTPAPATAGDLTAARIDDWAKAWGDLPGDVKAKFVQDLKARYGDDYARSIKLYFEQLAERK